MSIKKTGIWKFLSSIKLAIWLLAIIAFFSLAGTFIPQSDIYSSWWFILCLILLSLNLAVCLLNRLPFKKHSIGTVITHLSILVIFFGAFIGIVYGEKGFVKIAKTEEVSSFMSKGEKVNLSFSVRLDDFIYTEYIDPKEKLLVYTMDSGEGQRLIAEINTEAGVESDIADTGYRIKALNYLSDFVMDTITKVAQTRSARPDNPAIQVRLRSKAGQVSTFWVFARFPDMHQRIDPNFKFVYRWAGRRPKDFISKVTILKENKELMKKYIRVNEPLNFGGYKFFQSSYDTEALSWSGLQVVKDPGVPVVYAGFILLITGFMIIFYINPIMQRR